MIWPFNKTTSTVDEVAAVEDTASVPFLPDAGARLRNGMWVNAAGRIGILTQYIDADTVEVTHTKADGTTVMMLSAEDLAVPSTGLYPTVQVNQATISEIPRSRYETEEQLRSLGYGD